MEDDKKVNEAARELSKLGAAKGGKARANVLTANQRSEIARQAVTERWRKAGKHKESSLGDDKQEIFPKDDSNQDAEIPYAAFPGELIVGNIKLTCYVLSNGTRVLTQTGVLNALGMSHGGSGGTGGDRLAKFLGGKLLKPFVSDELLSRTEKPLFLESLVLEHLHMDMRQQA